MVALLRSFRPRRVDVGISLALLFLSVASTFIITLVDPVPGDRDPWPWGYALIALACLTVLWRGTHPHVVALLSMTAATVYYPLGFPDGVVMLCAAVMLYTLVRWGYRRFGWSLGLGLFIALNLWEFVGENNVRPEALGVIAWALVLLCAAEVMRSRAEYRQADRRRRAEAARTREEGLLRQASEARLHLARDVHDTVAHNISLINVQASTALYLMDSEPTRASEALATIKQASKDTLTELRSILDVLRAADEGAPRAPVPGLGRVDELADNTRSAGIDVRVEERGAPRHLPTGTGAAAYRIVQEALTNVVRHADASSASVRVEYLPTALRVEVIDDGRGANGAVVPGQGMIGMGERAALVGGTVDARPLRGGGFRVRAWLPTEDTSPDTAEAPGGTDETRSR